MNTLLGDSSGGEPQLWRDHVLHVLIDFTDIGSMKIWSLCLASAGALHGYLQCRSHAIYL